MEAIKIKEMRKTLGMTQVQFSDTLGISQGFLSDLEKGSKTPAKSLSLLLKQFHRDKNIESLNGKPIQKIAQSDLDLKLKYISLMEDHVKSLSDIINLKEELFRLKEVGYQAS